MNLECRVRSKKKIQIEPVALQAIKGYLVASQEKVFVYNVRLNTTYEPQVLGDEVWWWARA
ncbi:unnamed protein product [Brassica rapa subsp. narinosa]|uniref:(rape) hypothetical protein n=1 Tax=Brassica napus TaxID=3708 RepID=A0A816Z8Q7_BRANA|nr:unnamed protein product [Brassica napus]